MRAESAPSDTVPTRLSAVSAEYRESQPFRAVDLHHALGYDLSSDQQKTEKSGLEAYAFSHAVLMRHHQVLSVSIKATVYASPHPRPASIARASGLRVAWRLTIPSSGRPQAGFAHLRPPLMSNVGRHRAKPAAQHKQRQHPRSSAR